MNVPAPLSVVGSHMYVSCSLSHQVRHHLFSWSSCQIQLQSWSSSLASCKHYLKGTIDHKLVYQPTSPLSSSSLTQMLTDHGGNPDNGKSTGGYVVKISSGVVSWSFLQALQPLVALSVHHQSRAPLLLRQWRRLAMTSQVPPCLEWTTSLPLLWARTQSMHYISLELRKMLACFVHLVLKSIVHSWEVSFLANVLSFGASSAVPCVTQELHVVTECSRL